MNPWNVPNIQEFQFFCCPECDSQIKNSQDFIKHALKDHEQAKDSLSMKTEVIDAVIKIEEQPVKISIMKRKVEDPKLKDDKVQKLKPVNLKSMNASTVKPKLRIDYSLNTTEQTVM